MTAPAAGLSRTFRVFVSSTFSDFIEERNALQQYVFPRLAELCAAHQARFQAIDLRWGVSEEAALDQRTVAICLDEITRCQRLTPRPNFIVLLGDRYGWRPLPSRIEKTEFEQIRARVPETHGADSDRALLGRWYRLDENASPAEYVLLPREVDVPEGSTASARKAAQEVEERRWQAIGTRLRAIMLAAVDRLGWAENDPRRAKYVTSATEQEIGRGALEAKGAAEHVFAFYRTIYTPDGERLADAVPPDGSARDFIDETEVNGRWVPDAGAHDELIALREARLRPLLGANISDYRATWEGSGITHEHVGALPHPPIAGRPSGPLDSSHALDDCLKLLDAADVPHTLCTDVWRNLAATILSQLGKLAATKAAEAEIAAHESFGEDRRASFVGRAGPLAAIAKYLDTNPAGPLVIIGEPGSGKSALMAKAFEQAKATHPDSFAVVRFIGTTPGSSDGRTLLGSLCRQISRAYGADEPAESAGYEDLAVEFGKNLTLATAQRPLIVFLDALDQLGPADPAHTLNWLPAVLPEHVRLIVSALPGDCEWALRAKRPELQFLGLEKMTRAEGKTALALWLGKARRALRDHQREEILDRFEPEGRPLYLKLAFEEARLWHSYSERAETFLQAGIPDLISKNLFTRLAAPGSHGEMLVSHALGYLAASRYGLSEDELIDALSADEAVKADFRARSPRSPNVDRLPVVVWSRLYFDLEPYLAEHAADGVTLLAFYHNQLREAAAREFAGTEGPSRHAALANYFRAKAAPAGDGRWELLARPLAELPFHLAGGGLATDLARLLSELSYLAARVASSPVHGLIADYSLIGAHPAPAVLEWRGFLHKHLERLSRHPASLLSLVNHEGFAAAREQIATARWHGAWLRTAPETMPILGNGSTTRLRAVVEGSISFDHPRVTAVGAERLTGFSLERLGTLRVLDLAAMRETTRTLPIGPERPLALACAPDASSLAVLYQSGVAACYTCLPGPDGWPAGLELAAELRFRLPEFSDPLIVWNRGAYWFQAEDGGLARVPGDGVGVSQERLPIEESGELSALAWSGSKHLIAIRQDRDTLVLAGGELIERRTGVDACAACECGDGAAIAYTDGNLVVYQGDQTLSARQAVASGLVCGAIGWDQGWLVWLAEKKGLRAWHPGAAALVPVQDEEVFRGRLRVVPSRWITRPGASTLLVTSHSVLAYQLDQAGSAVSGRIDGLRGGPVWRAISRRADDWWLAEASPSRQILLQRNVRGRLYYDLDGRGRLYAASGNGPGVVLDVTTAEAAPLNGCPMQLNSAAGEPEGGCWFSDRGGGIHFADAQGRWSQAVNVGLRDVSGARLVDCGKVLLWWGLSSRIFGTGPEPATTFVFFRKTGTRQAELERIGMRALHPTEGTCAALWHIEAGDRLVALWAAPGAGTEPWRLRIGSTDDWISGRFQETRIAGLEAFRLEQGALSADQGFLGLLSHTGEMFCVRLADSQVVAALAGSVPFSAVTPGPASSAFWLAEGQTRVYRCSLTGGDA